MRQRLMVAIGTVVVMVLAVSTAAASANTVLVATPANGGVDGPSCGNGMAAPCATINGALNPSDGNAGNGDTISVGAGTFTEQDTITAGVTIDGAGMGKTIIQSPGHPMATCGGASDEPIECVASVGAPVTIENMTIDASGPGTDTSGDNPDGIFVLDATATILGVDVEHARLEPPSTLGGIQAGNGIRVIDDNGAPQSITIKNSIVSDYQKRGISVLGTSAAGNANLTYTITGNTVTEPPADDIGPNGIEVGQAGSGTISGNTVSGDECNEPGPANCVPNPIAGLSPYVGGQGAGILLFNDGTVAVSDNTVSGCDFGIGAYDGSNGDYIYSGTPSTYNVTDNTLTKNRYEGLFAGAGTTNASSNTITGSNIGVEAASFNNTNAADPGNAILNLTGNSITGNTTGIEQDVDTSGDNHPVTTAIDNQITGNTHGVVNNTSSSMTFTNNELTCAAGSGTQCTTGPVSVSGGLALKVTAAKSSIGTGGQTDTITAEIVDSSGNVITGALVPDGSVIGFATSLGSIPASATTASGVATATLTSGATAGSAVVAVGFGGQAATTDVQIGSPVTTPPTTRTTVITGAVLLSGARLRLSHGRVSFVVVNPQSQSITASLTLTARIGKHTVTIARRTVIVGARGHTTVSLSLSKAARHALSKRGASLHVTLAALVAGQKTSSTFTLTS